MKLETADYSNGTLTLGTHDIEALRFAAGFQPGDYTITRAKQKRSLDANAMYWSVLTQLAKAVGLSNPAMHNHLLRRYGQVERVSDKLVYVVLPDTEDGEEKALNAETFHLKPTSQVKYGNDGETYRTYLLLKGSHDYTKAEFSRLLDGLLDECKSVGIDVLSEREKSLLEDWRNGAV